MVKEIYPEAQITTIPDAGHWLHAEQPKLFMDALVSFI
jgi:pimeloyl-ACP methyl ester carboxylesterase